MPTPIITLTTDLGLTDYYVASIKGAILREINEVHIVDISHDIEKFNIAQGAFVLKNAIRDFPKGTIHLIGIQPNATFEINHLAIEYNGQYFIGADNGFFSLIFENPPSKVMELNIKQDTDLLTFPTKDVFVKAACHLARGGELEVIGMKMNSINERTNFAAVVGPNSIKGSVIYIDSYGNVITNITRELFKEVGKERPFEIGFRVPGYEINELHKNYADVQESERLALFGATNFLEVAINIGNAHQLMGLKLNDVVTISFYDR